MMKTIYKKIVVKKSQKKEKILLKCPNTEEELRRSYEIQFAINKLLKISLESISLEEMLGRALDCLIAVRRFKLEAKGAIFLVGEIPGLLILKGYKNLSPALQETCKNIPFGKCLCGQAALSGKIVFAATVNKYHENRYEGMPEHGHYCVPIMSSKKKVLGVLDLYLKENTLRDKKAEEFFHSVANVLAGIIERRKLEELKDEFVSTVSHELRTPLSIIKESISLILDRVIGQIDQAQERILLVARDNINRLSRLINDLLDISRIEANKLVLKRKFTDIISLIKHVSATFENRIHGQGLELKLSLPEGVLEVYLDQDRIIQVLTNLLGNAVKFTQKGFIEIKLVDKGKDVECSVCDTGIGIGKENLDKVFDKFQQFGRTEGGGDKGTGLGLSIIKGIIDMHHGMIHVESQLGKGTNFVFNLPKQQDFLLKESVNSNIQMVTEKGTKFSLFVLSITNFFELREKLSCDKIQHMIQAIKHVLKSGLYRSGDVVLDEADKIVVILTDCDKANSLVISKRLQKILSDYLIQNNLNQIINFSFGSATYSDDAKDYEGLIKFANGSKIS